MKTINIISNYSSLYAGNFIPSLLALANDLKAKCNVVFSFPVQAKERFWCKKIQLDGFRVFFFGKHIIRDLKKINKQEKCNIAYTHFLSTPIVKLLSPISRRLKLVIHVHSDFSGGQNKHSISQTIKKIVFGRFLRPDTKYIYVSEALMLNEKHKHSYYVRNALQINRILSEKFDYKEFTDKYTFNEKKLHFLMFGWSPFVKGVDTVVNAFNSLPQTIKEKVQLTIVHNYNQKNDLEKFIIDKCKNISFDLIKCEPVEDVFSLYNVHDIFISASRSEGFSYSILEALYNGLDVIASDIPGTEWSKKYGTITFKNESELSKIIENISLKQHQDKKINHYINNDFSIELWVKQIGEIVCAK